MIRLQNKSKRWFKPFLVTGIAVTLAGIPVGVRAQSYGGAQGGAQSSYPAPATNPTTNPPMGQSAGQSGQPAGQSASGGASANASVNVSADESRNFDQFLDSHAEISRQLRSNPALANDPDYLRANPDLRDYLQQHPELQTALRDHAADFFRNQQGQQGQQQYDAQDRDQGDRNNDRNGVGNSATAPDNDNRGQYQNQNQNAQNNSDRDNADRDAEMNRRNEQSARIDQFLADHPNIDKDLKSKPANVNDDGYLKKHAELSNFLRDNPDVRDRCHSNPAFFEDRDLRAQMIRTDFNGQNGQFDRDNGLRPDQARDDRSEAANFDRFLDSHREIAEQLRRNPSLAADRQFVQNHPELQTYLQQNPAVRDQLSRDPNVFMRQEDNFDRAGDRDRFVSFRQFMDQHPKIREDVYKNHALVKDNDYMHRNPELGDYLNQHPDVRDAWSSNPDTFVKGAQQINPSTTPSATTPGGAPATGTSTAPTHTGAAPGAGSSTSPSSTSSPATPPKTKQ